VAKKFIKKGAKIMTNTKMTERDIYMAMIDGTIDFNVMKEFGEKKLAQLDKQNAAARKRAETKRQQTDELLEVVAGFVTEEPKTRDQITDEVIAAGHDVTVGKVQSRLTALVRAERILKAKAKAVGDDGKAKVVTVYATELPDED
jgi:hypothetical protein